MRRGRTARPAGAPVMRKLERSQQSNGTRAAEAQRAHLTSSNLLSAASICIGGAFRCCTRGTGIKSLAATRPGSDVGFPSPIGEKKKSMVKEWSHSQTLPSSRLAARAASRSPVPSPRPHKYRIRITESENAKPLRNRFVTLIITAREYPGPPDRAHHGWGAARPGGVAGSALPRFAGAAGNHKTARHKSGLEPGYTSVATPSAGTQRVGWGAGKLAPPAGARTLDLAQHAMVWSMHTLRRSSAAWPRQDQVHQDRTLCIPVQESGGS